MPITYDVCNGGHFIHAVASDDLTSSDFIEYELAHATDDRLKPPVVELLEIQHGACNQITKDDCSRVIDRRKDMEIRPAPHRCAIVVSYADSHAWDLAMFYEGMVPLHKPESVIVFGDTRIARIWLGVDD